jgi:hypothetical protein
MAIDYSRYRPDLSTLGIGTGRYGARTPQYNRQINRIRRYFKTPRNYQKNAAGLGYVLPKIGGLRLRDINTAQGRRTAITGGPGNFIYGFTDRKKFKIGRVGDGLGLVARGGTRGAAAAPSPGTPAPPPDEYAKYDKDYKWIGDYLRGLRSQEQAFGTMFKNEFQPSVSAALTSMGNLATGAADRYARAAAAGAAANQAAANLAPVQAAGSTEAFDPIGLAAEQAASRATGAAAAENARMGATMSALAPVTAGQGILANIQRGYSAISAEYANKRLEDQMKLEQWIAEQKADAEDRAITQQYNAAMLGLRGDQLSADIASDQADRDAKGDRRSLERDGWIALPPGAGTRGLNITTANDGTKMYKPKSGGGSGRGSGSGAGGLTAGQRQGSAAVLGDLYSGKMDPVGDPVGGWVNSTPEDQVSAILGWLQRNGPDLGINRGNLAAFLREALSGRVSGNWKRGGKQAIDGLVAEVVRQYGG